jgi:hypothetical protein
VPNAESTRTKGGFRVSTNGILPFKTLAPKRCLAAAFLALALPSLAWPGPLLIDIFGDVKVVGPSGSEAPARQDSRLEPGSRLLSGRASRAVLRFDDNSKVEVGPESNNARVAEEWPPVLTFQRSCLSLMV